MGVSSLDSPEGYKVLTDPILRAPAPLKPLPMRSGPILPATGLRKPPGGIPKPGSSSQSGFTSPPAGSVDDSHANIQKYSEDWLSRFFPPRPQGTSPSGTSTPSTPPEPTRNPDPSKPDGERDVIAVPGDIYLIRTNYKYRSIVETVWVGNTPKFRHLRWDIEGEGIQFFQAPFKLIWKYAEEAIVKNYINPPSPYQWLRLVHANGVYDLTGNSTSYFAITEWSLTPQIVPGSAPIPGTMPSEITLPTLDPPVPQPLPERVPFRTPTVAPPLPPIPTLPPLKAPPRDTPRIPSNPARNPTRPAPLPPTLPNRENPSNPDSPGKDPDKGQNPPGMPPKTPGVGTGTSTGTGTGTNKKPDNARDSCTPPGSYEKMTCRYQPADGQKLDEILKRVGKPQDPGGIAAIVGEKRPRHPVTKLPTDLGTMSRLNFLVNSVNAVFAPFNFIANIHNAFMLSADIKETVGSFMSITLDVVRTALSFKDPDDAMIDINDIVNKNFESMMDNLLGASNWELIKQRASAVNRIYMAQTNAMYAVKNAFDSVFEAMGTIGQYTGKIGNALKKAQVVYEDAYDWMDEERSNEMARMGRFGNLTGRLEGVEDAANMLLAIASSVKEVQEGAKDLADSLSEYERAKADAYVKWSEGYSDKIKNQKETQAPDAIAEVELKTFDFEDN